GSILYFAPQRKSIQCHLWHCQRAYQPYCSSSHSELALLGEEGRNAIVIADGMKDQEINEISGKIVRSTVKGKRCGIPHVFPSDLCSNPWELEGFVFNRELELDETRRSWVFFCENNPEDFGTVWKLVGGSKEISPGIYCQKYILTPDYASPGGRFLLSKVTGWRFSLALYWMTFLAAEPKVESEEDGKVTVVPSEGETSKRKLIDCDPSSQLPNKATKIGRVDGAMESPNTNVSHSVHVLAHKSDMNVFCLYSHNVAAKGKFIAFVSTDAETENPQTELKAGIDLLCPVDEIFFDMYDRYEPANEPASDNCFISTSYDATTQFETTVADVLNMYTLITGEDYNEKDSKTHSGMVDNTIAIMSHPIPNTNDPRSVHVIISQKQLAHKSDILKMKAILMLVVNPSLDHNFIAKTDNYFPMFRKYNDVCLLLFILPQRGPPRESSSHLFLNDAETDNPQP
ncbi:hypothetical protein IGI04_037893, partial [Brassica rapa subsp. trilocularis]